MVINCQFDEFDDDEWWDEDIQVEVFQVVNRNLDEG